jgi:hypothetical protein
MALRLLAKIEKHAEETFAAAAWMLERRFGEVFARPEIQLMARNNFTTMNSLTINVSASDAQALESRSASVTAKVARLFDDWKERTGAQSAETDPDPEPKSIYGQIIPPDSHPLST